MPNFLSPGIIVREIDLSANAANNSPMIPAFVGTAQKGPVNDPTVITSQAQFIDVFGEPFIDSNLGYAAMAFFEEGDFAYILRVGIECEEGQASALGAVCIDTTGAMVEGWGRIPLFTGIDFGRIVLSTPSVSEPFTFHVASADNFNYTDIDVSSTDGSTVAALTIVDDTAYIGAIDDAFTVLITSGPTAGEVLEGAEYSVTRQSDGVVVATGTLTDSGGGVSTANDVGEGDDANGLDFVITVTGASPLELDDSFSFQVHPDNRSFAFSVEGATATVYTITGTYTDADAFVTAFNVISGISGESFSAVNSGDVLKIQTDTAGERIQLVGSVGATEPDTEAFALEVGTSKWDWDVPRSHLFATEPGPYDITTERDRVTIRVVGATDSVDVAFSLPVALATSAAALATAVDSGGIYLGERYWNAVELQVTDDDSHLLIVASQVHELEELQMLANASYIESLRFAQETGILFPYKKAYRTFSDTRVVEPAPGVTDPSTPLACEDDPLSSTCTSDSAYYQNIVGYVVAKTPGVWAEDIRLTLENFVGTPGVYELTVADSAGNVLSRYEEVSFDPDEERYIANLINEGSTLGGVNGDSYIQWVERDANIGEDEVRLPGSVSNSTFSGGANGIPPSAVYSSELDRAVIGSAALGSESGLHALSNPDEFNITLLSVPGNSSGAVIGQMISFCESRGDVLALIDPPFGLRPQQVVDWHNGLLLSDLTGALNTSYAALYWSWLEIFDQFSGQNVFVPPSGHVSGVYARTGRVAEIWDAPAGLNRGRILTAVALEYRPTKGERDLLYGLGNAVNPIANLFQEGHVVWGQRTLQRKRSALDRVNVRMLLIHLKKVLPRALRPFLFEPNTPAVWSQVEGLVDAVLTDIAARNGVEAFQVIVNETNNTPQRRDNNELWVSVLIKPVKTIEFIVLNLAVLRSSQSFAAEEVLRAAGVVGNLS